MRLCRCIDFCNIFTELCITLSFYLINQPNTILGDFNCLNLLLMCATHKDYEVIIYSHFHSIIFINFSPQPTKKKIFQKSFIFWFTISEDIYTNEHSEEACNNFLSYVESLLEAICKHCRLPMNHVKIVFYLKKNLFNCFG